MFPEDWSIFATFGMDAFTAFLTGCLLVLGLGLLFAAVLSRGVIGPLVTPVAAPGVGVGAGAAAEEPSSLESFCGVLFGGALPGINAVGSMLMFTPRSLPTGLFCGFCALLLALALANSLFLTSISVLHSSPVSSCK